MKLKRSIITFLITIFVFTNVQAQDECFEGMSRGIFKFNQGFDKAILKPIAVGYNKLPDPIKKGTSNFTSNIATLLSVPNHLLPANWRGAGEASASLLINYSIGILGMGKPAMPQPLHIRQKLKETIDKPGVGRYSVSRGIIGLRKAQSNYYKRRFNVDLDFNKEIIVTI